VSGGSTQAGGGAKGKNPGDKRRVWLGKGEKKKGSWVEKEMIPENHIINDQSFHKVPTTQIQGPGGKANGGSRKTPKSRRAAKNCWMNNGKNFGFY